MGAGFGYENYATRKPAPTPAEVGQRLLQQSQGMMPTGPEALGAPTEPGEAEGAAEAQSMVDAFSTPDWPSAAEAALRSAILRIPHASDPQNVKAPAIGNRSQLSRLGVPEHEITLLGLQGGANV